jgi:hypothetical protein
MNDRAFGFNASWPTGGLKIDDTGIEVIVFKRRYTVAREFITSIHYYRLPRPYIRIFHMQHSLPPALLFGTLRYGLLKRALRDHGYSIAATFWIEPEMDMDYSRSGPMEDGR